MHAIIDDALHYLEVRGLQGLHRTIKLPSPKIRRTIRTSSHSVCQYPIDTAEGANRLFIWSAADMKGLSRLAEAYLQFFRRRTGDFNTGMLTDLAYTLSEKRSRLPWKSFAVAGSVCDLSRKLIEGLPAAVRSTETPNIGFSFTGQGMRIHYHRCKGSG